MKISIETTQNVVIEYQVASIGDRIIGYFIDLIIFIAVLLVGFLIIDSTLEGDAKTFAAYAILIPTLFYDFAFEALYDGQSPGKMAMKMKVIDLSGKQPTIGAYFIRWIMRPLDFGIFSGAIALIAVIIGGKGQRLGDLLAGTTVVKIETKDRFSEVLFPAFDENYELTFPQVAQIGDKDINIIKEVLRRYRSTRDSSSLQKMSIRVKDTLEITTDLPHYQFLDKIVKDYHHLSSAE